jgi:hypothetical protein
MSMNFCLLIWTHAYLYFFHLFYLGIILLIEFSRILKFSNQRLEMRDVLFLLPCACLDVPVEPLHQIILSTVLFLYIKNFFYLVVLLGIFLWLVDHCGGKIKYSIQINSIYS